MENFYTEEEKYWLTGGNTGTLPDRITPSKINVLKQNEIFVFGSNIKGAHLGGAARAAYNKFGAEWKSHSTLTLLAKQDCPPWP